MSKLRWGILSTARINRALIPPLNSLPRHELLAVASRDLARAQTYAQEKGIPRAYGTYQALLDDPEVEVVYNPLPNGLHAEWTIRAARAGKHVLCEKPLALRVAEVEAIAEAARENGVVVAEAFMYRHHPQTLRVRELVQQGAVGRLQLVRGSFSFSLTREPDVRLEPAQGGGSLWDVGCYPVSYARWVIGAEPLEAFGWQRTGPTGVDLAFAGQLRFPGEVVAQLDCSFTSPYHTRVEVVGEKGTLVVGEPFKPGLQEALVLQRGDETERIAVPGQELYSGEVEDMAEAVISGRPPRISLADSRGNTAAILALLESARTGQVVRVEG